MKQPQLTTRLAGLLGITRGQASTIVVALAVAAVLAVGGLPPVLRRGPVRTSDLLGAPAAAAASDASRQPVTPTGDATPAAPAGPSFADAPAVPVSSFTAPSASPAPSTPSEPSPSATPSGPSRIAELPRAAGVALSGGRIVVASNPDGAAPSVHVLRDDGSIVRTHAFPARPAGAGGLTGLVVTGSDTALVLDAGTARVVRLDLGSGAQRTYAELPDLPACSLVVAANAGCEPGVRDDRPLPFGAATGADGTLFVTDAAQGAIWRVPPGGGRAALLSNDIAFGGGSGSTGVTGIAVEPGGNLLVAVPEAVDPRAGTGGALYRVTPAGERSVVTTFARGDAPAGVTLADGKILVALRGAGSVLVLDAAGGAPRRITGGEGGLALTEPFAAVVRAGNLLVTDRNGVVGLGPI